MIGPLVLAGCLLLAIPADGRPAPATQNVTETPVEAVLVSLRAPGTPPDKELLERAYRLFRTEVSGFRLASALSIAQAMHDRAGAVWSAMSLALLQSRMGRIQEAQATLEAQLTLAKPGPEYTDLQERLGLVLLGAGRRDPALGFLGRAWLAGSDNAGQVLGALALSGGHPSTARRVFGSLIPTTSIPGRQPPPWALRGWGLAMVGPAQDPGGHETSGSPVVAQPAATSTSESTTH